MYIIQHRFLKSIKDVYLQCRENTAIADECCRILLLLSICSLVLSIFNSFLDDDQARGIHRECLRLLMMIAQSCIQQEETIRLCAQILRVIASGKSASLLLEVNYFDLLEMVFNQYSSSASVLLHSFCSILHLLRNIGFESVNG